MKSAVSLRLGWYARVSGDRQAEERTIDSQVAALRERIAADGGRVEGELEFRDDGYSGGTRLRHALERLRDLAAQGALDRLYVHSPDRLARNFAHQVLLLEELAGAGVEVVFLNHALGQSPEGDLLLQVQGVIAEYERAKIRERIRRGKLHAARSGQVSVLGRAPYGYRYVRKQEGGGEPSPAGQARWGATSVAAILNNPAYRGQAAFRRHQVVPRQPPLRPVRGKTEVPRRPYSVVRSGEPIFVPVPALVSAEDFAAAEQLAENRRRRERRAGARHLLQGLVVCGDCGYAFVGSSHRARPRAYHYYRRCGSRAPGAGPGRCPVGGARGDPLEAAVWADICALLRQPQRIEAEYQRRLHEPAGASPTRGLEPLSRVIEKVKRSIARLLDLYSDGLLERSELGPGCRLPSSACACWRSRPKGRQPGWPSKPNGAGR
jgi:site-specific DNA recombinase